MNEVDIAILLIVGLSIYHGVRRGVLSGTIDLISIPLALAIGSFGWPVFAWVFKAIGFPYVFAGVLGFVGMAAGVAFGSVYLGLWLTREWKPPEWLDRAGGGTAGFLFGILLSALLLMFSGIIPNARAPMEKSGLGMRLVGLVPASYSSMERAGVVVPKLVMLPTDYRQELQGVRQGLQFMQINFSHLEGVMCMKCRSEVEFVGYRFKKGTLISPKFECTNCGRTSDGCQTFEGFHRIYDRCPVELAREGVRFDCGVWTNGDFIAPLGECPVDGNIFEEMGDDEYLWREGKLSRMIL